MDFTLSPEQKALRESIVQFARKELNEDLITRDREQIFRRDLWEKCGQMMLQGLPVPEEYGGAGGSVVDQTIFLEGVSRGMIPAAGYGTTAIVQGASGIGFAIPADRAQRVVDDLLRFGELQPLWLGMRLVTIDPELAARIAAAGQRDLAVKGLRIKRSLAVTGEGAGGIAQRLIGASLPILRAGLADGACDGGIQPLKRGQRRV